MKTTAPARTAFLAAAASIALAGCGSSQSASQGATADTVELPAEEAMSGTSAMPSDMQTEMATVIASDEGIDTPATDIAGAGSATGTAAATDAPGAR